MKFLFSLAACLSAATFFAQELGDTKSILVKVTNLNDEMAEKIDSTMRLKPGIVLIRSDYRQQMIFAKYDSGEITIEQLIALLQGLNCQTTCYVSGNESNPFPIQEFRKTCN